MIANLILALTILFTGVPATAADVADPTNYLMPCEYEDSENCFWDASERGNKIGNDFHNIDGVVYYACDGFEDSANCFWDATKQGNGVGRSFTDVNGEAVYWDEVAAWSAFDTSNASTLLVDGGKVTYAGAYDGHAITDSEIVVWDAEFRAYLFTIS